MPRYLSKSRFRLSLDCPTKLFYTGKKEYANQQAENDFLQELAKGGLQIGEYAKYFFSDDPESITIQTQAYEYEESIKQTNERLKADEAIIAEGSFLFNNCYVRADIIVKKGGQLYLYEVKAKGFEENQSMMNAKGALDGGWAPYLYDVAFQKWVIENATGLTVVPQLILVNKSAICDVAGLAQHFKIFNNAEGKAVLKVTPNLRKEALGKPLIMTYDASKECEWIYTNPVESILTGNYSFTDYIAFATDHYVNDKKIYSPPSKVCKGCEFQAKPHQEEQGLKSGKKECWVGNKWVSQEAFQRQDLATELWGGLAGRGSVVEKLIQANHYTLSEALRADFDSKNVDGIDELSNHQRREIQIQKVRDKDTNPHVETAGLEQFFNTLKYPLHFIDFETTATPLPWYKGLRPYQGVAFQFSHHTMQADGSVAHKNQYLNFAPGTFPNFSFVRELQKALGDSGTIFRYHNHENSYLRMIYRQLESPLGREVQDKDELMAFINSITKDTIDEVEIKGERNMLDLYEVVLRNYYSPKAGGSNSLKKILPAAIHDFPFIREKYSQAIYGKNLAIPSLNYDSKIWIREEHQNDPYKTLGPIFDGYPPEYLDEIVGDFESKGIADGGAAMMAYNMLQLSEIPLEQRERIKTAMLRYCELDTLAMVMVLEGLKSQI
jgi:hypothetical protein